MLAQVPRGQQDAVRGEQRIVVALGGAAGVVVDGVLGGGAVHARLFVEGVAHAWGGQLGQHGLQGGAGLGGQAATQLGHAVGSLGAQGQTAPTGAVLVAVGAVGVEPIGQPGGELGELFGPDLGCALGELGCGVVARGAVHAGGQLVVEAADHRDVLGAERALPLACGGARQHRRQRFSGESVAGAEVGGVVDAPGGLGAADQRPVGDRMRQCAAQFFGRGLAGQVIDQRMLDGRDPPSCLLATLQQQQLVIGAQRIDVQPQHRIDRGVHGIKRRSDRLQIDNTGSTHDPRLATATDKNGRAETAETQVAQVV